MKMGQSLKIFMHNRQTVLTPSSLVTKSLLFKMNCINKIQDRFYLQKYVIYIHNFDSLKGQMQMQISFVFKVQDSE